MQSRAQSFAVQSHRGPYVVRRESLASVLASGLTPADRLIIDRTVQELHPAVSVLAPAEQTCSVTANEALKSLDGVTSILAWLLESGFNRSGTLYVAGGGTVQDAACFVASILHRGARWIFAPTTLLAQGDSCIGSKSSINYGGYKNQLGTFYPPAEIIVDDLFLETLLPDEVRSGVGEMLHYAVLGGETVLAAYEVALTGGWEQLRTSDMTALAMRALAVKRNFIEIDEFDTDFRKNLNLGHTFGHALEFASGGRIAHGIAVAYGIDLATSYAEEQGVLRPATRARVGGVIRRLLDGRELAGITGVRLLEGMSKDKKRSDNGVELVLIKDLGKPVRSRVQLDDRLGLFLDNYLASWGSTGAEPESYRPRVGVERPVGRYDESHAYHDRAIRSLARGVSSAMKATQTPVPICASRGVGSHLWDADGNEYIDFALSFGPMLLGQSPNVVVEAVHKQLDSGIGFGAGNRYEAPLAELICDIVPSAELVIFSNTGTEAVQAALRVARSATGRNRIIKFRGHYHGWLDSMHIGVPGVPGDGPGTGGQDPFTAHETTICEWNSLTSLAEALADDVAAVIMEPININGGCLAPEPGYLEGTRRLTTAAGALLIFDEVITGFRVALGGAQELLGITPDMTVLGKALGSGFPISAVCGPQGIMSVVASGKVAHMGNFNGNPVAAAASHAAVSYLEKHSADIYPRLDRSIAVIADAFDHARAKYGVPIQFNRTVGAGFAFVSDQPVHNHDDRVRSDIETYGRFAARMLDEGIFIPARGLWYASTEHSEDDLVRASDAILRMANEMADGANGGRR